MGPWRTVGDDVQYRVATHDDRAVFYFQCTNSYSDWANNFRSWVRPYRGAEWYAHAGYVAMYKSAREWLLDEAVRYIGLVVKIEVVGYSQGAAIATMFHEDLWYNHLPNEGTYTFGGPRVVWLPGRKLRARFDGLTRFVRRGDIVTMVPPWTWGFRHVGAVERLAPLALPSPMRHYPSEYAEYLE